MERYSDSSAFKRDLDRHLTRDDDDGTLGPCGCVDYHMADCPIRTGDGDAPYPRDYDDSGYYDDHPPEGWE